MKKILIFIKNHVFSLACFLVAAIVFATGSVSYARYASKESNVSNVGPGSFSCSTSIDGISALSFTNTDFWGKTDDNSQEVALNVLRNIDVAVNNFAIEDGQKRVNNVKTEYSLIFTAPEAFANLLAFQVLDENGMAIIPQIVMSDLLNLDEQISQSWQYNTANSKDYNGLETEDLIFNVAPSMHSSNLFYTAISESATITVEKIHVSMQQSIEFRLWDVSSLTREDNRTVNEERGKLLSPLVIMYTESVSCYRVSISVPQFVFEPGVEQTHKYSIRLAPIDEIDDKMLDARIMVPSGSSGYNDIYSENMENTVAIGNTYSLQKLIPGETNRYSVYNVIAENIIFNGEQVNDDSNITFFDVIEKADGTTYKKQKYFVSKSYAKSYPLSVKVLFEQVQQ